MAASMFRAITQPSRYTIDDVKDLGFKVLDYAYGMAVNNHRFTRPFFEKGWGNMRILEYCKDFSAVQQEKSISDLNIKWEKIKEGTHNGTAYELLQGVFDTPCCGPIRDMMPSESRLARAQLLRPLYHNTPDLVIHLAGTGDHGFVRRMRLGYGLLKDGIASLALELPYYGNRRPVLQVRSKLRNVTDLLILGRATIDESLCLLKWAKANGYNRLCMAGLSMGGVHSVMVTSLAIHDVACAALLAPHSASEPFCHGMLWYGTSQRWTPERHLSPVEIGINTDTSDPTPSNPTPVPHSPSDNGLIELGHGYMNMMLDKKTETVHRKLAQILSITDTTTLPLPRRPDAAVFVAANSDLYVSPRSVAKIHRHWPGSELRY
eukprot:Ihof_evm4s56 gene=Ihof_evmTU4s56